MSDVTGSTAVPIRELTIRHDRIRDGYSDLKVRIEQNDRLVMDAVDADAHIEQQMGDWDYEYSVTVPSPWVHSVLLHLLKERFDTPKSTSDFMAWLAERGIPHQFSDWR